MINNNAGICQQYPNNKTYNHGNLIEITRPMEKKGDDDEDIIDDDCQGLSPLSSQINSSN